MKYFVEVGGREMVVEVDGHRVTIDGRTCQASLLPLAGTPLRQLSVDGRPRTLVVLPAGRGHWALELGGERWEAEVMDERTRHIRSLTARRGRAAGGGVLRAPMPGLVVRMEVEVGQAVSPGAGVLVLEAMKMENELRASTGGTIRAVLVEPGQAVEKGQVLVEWE